MRFSSRITVSMQRIHQFHDRADGRIEIEPIGDIVGHFADRSVQRTAQFFFLIGQCRRVVAGGRRHGNLGIVADNAPQAVQKSRRSFDALVAPLQIAFRGRRKQDKQAGGIRAVFFYDFFRRYNVAFGFGHFRAILDDHALRQQIFEGFVSVNKAGILENLGEKPGIQQMQDRVLYPADILVDRQPIVGFVQVPRRFGVAWIRIAVIIPGRANKSIHGVGFPAGRFTAFWTSTIHKFIDSRQR